MAKSKKVKSKKTKIQNREGSGFGKFQEGHGGGTPIGGVYGGGHGRGIWKKAGSPGHRKDQPRTADGKFTYNSVNGKSITTSESRGTTVNPLLTGGQNGIQMDEVAKQFDAKSGEYWDKYKDDWYTEGGEVVTRDLKTRVASEPIWVTAHRKYDVKRKEFEGESGLFSKEGKRGVKTLDEKAAVQKVKATGKEQNVIDSSTGGIRIKPGVNATSLQQTINSSPTLRSKYSTPQSTGVQSGQTTKPWQKISTTSTTTPTQSPVAPSGSAQLTHSPEELKIGRQLIAQKGVDVSSLTDETLDQVWDQFFE